MLLCLRFREGFRLLLVPFNSSASLRGLRRDGFVRAGVSHMLAWLCVRISLRIFDLRHDVIRVRQENIDQHQRDREQSQCLES